MRLILLDKENKGLWLESNKIEKSKTIIKRNNQIKIAGQES